MQIVGIWGAYFDGAIDELRISNVVRSPQWIKTEHNNQINPGSFFSVGGEQTHYSELNNNYIHTNIPFYQHITSEIGYVVDIHGHENQESETTPFYLEGYDAVLISQATDDDWTISLRDAAIPVLTWDYDTYDELYLGAIGGNISSTTISIVNTTHFITEVQSLGNTNIYSGSSSMGYLQDFDPPPFGSELDLLATNGSDSTGQLIALEKSDVDYNPPHTAPERRVFWPGLNGSALNPGGWTLFDRALQWVLNLTATYTIPIIQDGGFTPLPTEDAMLQFWFSAVDEFPGIDNDSGFVNITAINPIGAGIYPMVYNGTHFSANVGLPYWNVIGVQRNSFSYNFTISDLSGLSTTGGGAVGINVPDIVAPNLVDFGVEYTAPDFTIWCNATDGLNGSQINTLTPSVNVSYKILHNNSWFGPFEMDWNSTSSLWEYLLSGITGADSFTYNFTARDRAEPFYNFVDNQGDPGYFDPSDNEPPVASDYGHDYYGNGTVRVWARVLDVPGYNGLKVDHVDVKFNSTMNPAPQTENMIRYDNTTWEWVHYFPWNQTLSPYAVNYTIARMVDWSGNENTTLSNLWDSQHSLIISDLEPPEISLTGFDVIPDNNGHLRFWAAITDSYSGLNLSRIFINITLSSGASYNYSMIYNGTFYAHDTYIAYWNDTARMSRMSIMYNVTAFDLVGLSAIPNNGGPTEVPDDIPSDLDTGVHDYHNGTMTIWASASDGVYGSGFPLANDSVLLNYRKYGIGGQFITQMEWNGSGNWYTYTFQNLLAGDILQYHITAQDVALNSQTTPSYMYGVGDETPPTIYDSGHEFIPSVGGLIRIWANVSEDIGGLKEVKVIGSPVQFNGTLIFNQTFYIFDVYANFNTAFSYNITASNLAGLTSQTPLRTDTAIDIVAPPLQNFIIIAEDNNQDTSCDFRISVNDTDYGSGINSNAVYFIYRVGGASWEIEQMTWASSTNYDYKVEDVFVGDTIDYYVRATDNSGNTGEGLQKTFGVRDETDPEIDEIGYDYLPDADSHLSFYCDAEDPFGTIGKVEIEITGDHEETGTMIWNGEEYAYDTMLMYDIEFDFEITVRDTAGNEDTMSESCKVKDKVSPRTDLAGGEEFQNGTAILWANVEDSEFGSGLASGGVTISYRKNEGGWSQEAQMIWNSTAIRFEYVINGLSVGDGIDYFIRASDKVGNSETSRVFTFIVPDLTPPIISTWDYVHETDLDGHLLIWGDVIDPFGTIVNVRATIVDINSSQTSSVSLLSNGTHFVGSISLPYTHVFNLTLIARDAAGLTTQEIVSYGKVQDVVPPKILDVGVKDFHPEQNGTILIWSSLRDGINGCGLPESKDSVYVEYMRNSNPTTTELTQMQWNNETNSYEIVIRNLAVGDTIDYNITAADKQDNVGRSESNVFAMADLTPPQINAFGYSLLPTEDGLVRFWVKTTDPFGTINRVYLTISINQTSTMSKSANSRTPISSVLLERDMVFNGTHYYHDEHIGYHNTFSYRVLVEDGAGLQSDPEDVNGRLVEDGAPPRVLNAEILDSGNKLTIWAEVQEEGAGVEQLNVIYSLDGGETWKQIPMQEVNTTHYVARMEVNEENEVHWDITTKDLVGNVDKSAWNVWREIPYKVNTQFPREYVIGIIGAIAVIAGITLKQFNKKRREWALDTQKRRTIEYITDITNFKDLLVITPSGLPFYTFIGMDGEQGQDSTMYSSFLMALKSFSAEVLFDTDVLTQENHFKFGGTEIILYDIRDLTFAFMFSAQMRDGIWKKVSHNALEHVKELATHIEHNFRDVIRAFQTFGRARGNPQARVLEMVVEGLEIDYIFPHRIMDLNVHREIGIPEENSIIQAIKLVSLENGDVQLIQVLENLQTFDINPDDIILMFHQLREEGAIVPVTTIQQRTEISVNEELIDDNSENEAQRVTLNPEEISSRLKQLQSIITNHPENESRSL